jgi:hypothetical protein
MVSSTFVRTDTPSSSTVSDRGIVVTEESMPLAGSRIESRVVVSPPFWQAVIAGTLFALSVFALSWYLMLGCHVGITSAGVVALGAGAAVWMWVTACVAYFFGGMIAQTMSPSEDGWLKGAAIWGLSIPLSVVIYGIIAQSLPWFGGLSLPHAGFGASIGITSFGYAWSAFITLGLALCFSLLGSMTGSSRRGEMSHA